MEDLRKKLLSCLSDEQLGLFHAKEFSEDLENCMLDNLNPIQYGHYSNWKEAEENQPELSIVAGTITDSGVSTCDDVLGEIKSLRDEMKVFQSTLLTTFMDKMSEMEKRLAKSMKKEKMFYDQGSQTDEIVIKDEKTKKGNTKMNVKRQVVENADVNKCKSEIQHEFTAKKQVASPSSQKIVQMQSAIEQDLLKLQEELGELNSTANKKLMEKLATEPPVYLKRPIVIKRRLAIEFPSSLTIALCEKMKTLTEAATIELQVDRAMRSGYSVIHIKSMKVEEILNLANQIWTFLKGYMTANENIDDQVLTTMLNSWSRWERLLFQVNCNTAIGYQPDTNTWSLISWDKSLIDASLGRATTLQITAMLPSKMFNFPL